MPSHEIALPAGSKNLSPALPTITRYSKDGDIPVIRLFGGDNFIGDVLEGQWLKGNDGVIVGPHTAIITGGQLELTGKAAVAANHDKGWIDGQDPFLIIQNAYFDIHLKVPTAVSSNEMRLEFYLRADKTVSPYVEDNYLRVRLERTSTPVYRIQVEKKISGTLTTIYALTTTTNEEGTFRIKFRPDDGKLDVYYHDGSGDIVESTDELTLSNDTLDLAFSVAYPTLSLSTADTTLYTLISEKMEVSYPDIDIKYDLSDEAFQGEGSELLTKAFDTSGNVEDGTITGSTWKRDGKFGKALHFDGINDYVDIPSTTYDLSATTFAWWSKRDVLIAEYPDISMAVLGSPSSSYAFIMFASTGNLQIETNTNADAAVGLFTDDKDVWHHYAIVCDNYVVAFYEDGIDITTESTIVDDITLDRIGRSGAVLRFEGVLDDIRIYDSVLTQANIQAIMADNPPAGAIREWLFDGGNTRGDVVCYDTRGETDETLWQRVYAEDHEFSGNCVMENGLVRVLVNEAIEYGLHLYFWNGEEFSLFLRTQLELRDDGKPVKYPFLLNIGNIDRAESIELKVRVCDTSVEDSDYYVDLSVTLTRGMHHCTYRIDGISLEQDIRFPYFGVQQYKFGYCGDVESKGIGHYQLSLSVSNTVMTDNFMAAFNNTALPGLFYMAVNEKPNQFYSYIGQYVGLYSLLSADLFVTEMHLGFAPFRKIANLFKEAEDATLSGGATANHFEDGFDVDSSGEYEGDISDFTWDTTNSRIITVGTPKSMIRVDNLEFGAGTYEHKWTPKHAQASGSLVFCAGREAYPSNPCDPLNGYTAKFSANSSAIYLYRFVNGSNTLLDSESFTFVANIEYKITVHCHESAGVITVDIDDVEKLSVSSETTYTSGAFGFGNATIVDSWFDSVAIDAEEVESSGNSAVMLDVQNELVMYELTAITDIPAGRYLGIFRLKSTGQISNEAAIDAYNSTDSKFINEAGIYELLDLTASYAYYSLVFDIVESDAGDTIRLLVQKSTTGSTTIVCDYMLIIPIGDGESFPQDIAHSALRSLTKKPKLVER